MDGAGHFSIAPDRWYGWQMLPGYSGDNASYFSPIRVSQVTPLKSGKGLLDLEFFNAFYAEGAQGFNVRLGVIARRAEYLIAKIEYADGLQRDAIVTRLSEAWLRRHTKILELNPPERMAESLAQHELDYYLNCVFFQTLRPGAP